MRMNVSLTLAMEKNVSIKSEAMNACVVILQLVQTARAWWPLTAPTKRAIIMGRVIIKLEKQVVTVVPSIPELLARQLIIVSKGIVLTMVSV